MQWALDSWRNPRHTALEGGWAPAEHQLRCSSFRGRNPCTPHSRFACFASSCFSLQRFSAPKVATAEVKALTHNERIQAQNPLQACEIKTMASCQTVCNPDLVTSSSTRGICTELSAHAPRASIDRQCFSFSRFAGCQNLHACDCRHAQNRGLKSSSLPLHQREASLSAALLWRRGSNGLGVHAGRHYCEGQTGTEGLHQDTCCRRCPFSIRFTVPASVE